MVHSSFMPNLQDIHSLRLDTPGCAQKIHLNNAGSSLPPKPVLEAMQNHLALEAEIGGYEAADLQAEAIAHFYPAVARLLNAEPRNIAFEASATDAYVKALSAVPLEPGDTLLTTDDDYISNQLAFLYLRKRLKINVIRAKKLPGGGVDVASMEELMAVHQPKLVAVTHVPTNSGLVQDVHSIGKRCRERGIWYLVDACQSAGQMPLDVQAIGCDFLSATMRKWLRGPRGAGFLFASDRVLEAGLEPFCPDMFGANWLEADRYKLVEDARRFEHWEKAYALLLGSKAAVEYALELDMESVEKRVTALAELARQQLSALPGVRVLDKGEKQCGIVTATVTPLQSLSREVGKSGVEGAEVQRALRAANVNVSISTREVAVIDFDEKGVKWAMRMSPHYFNTPDEIGQAVAALGGFLKEKMSG